MEKIINDKNMFQKRKMISIPKIAALILIGILIMSLSACKKATLKGDESNSSSAVTSETNTGETTKPSETQESSQDQNSQTTSIESQPFTFEDLSHNVYTGTIGNENVVMDIYPNNELGILDISFIGDLHNKDTIYTGGASDNKFVYEDDSLKITLYQTAEGVLKGSFTESKEESKDIALTLSHISGTHDPDQRYLIGTNEEIEAFAAEIKKVIANDDIKALSKMIAYPISIHIEEGATAHNEEDLIAMSAQAVITPELKKSIASTFPRFMFSNSEGIMLGSGEYNIWFSKVENGLKIIAINK